MVELNSSTHLPGSPEATLQQESKLNQPSIRVTDQYRLYIDSPRTWNINDANEGLPIDSVIGVLVGWIGHPAEHDALTVRLRGAHSEASIYARPDLDPAHGTGFSLFFDLSLMSGGELALVVYDGRELVLSSPVSPSVRALDAAKLHNQARPEKKAKVLSTLRYPPREAPGCRAPSFLPDTFPVDPRLAMKRDHSSAHDYDNEILHFIQSLGQGALVLDAGAGLRRFPHPSVVTTEIYDYPSTDVLAIGQELPFKDNTFDGVISSAVLEHVDDPFKCAKEIVRVLRPGGRVYVSMPFMQIEHGYPSHYFNATRFGIRKLFEDCEVERQWLGWSNHPIFSVHQLISNYAELMDPSERERFLQLTVRELIAESVKPHNGETVPSMKMSVDNQWILAWGTTALFRKPVA